MRYLVMIFFSCCLMCCSKETENFSAVNIKELYPIQVGKTFTYRLDSTVVATFGAQLLTKSYIIKDSIESKFLDNSGRTAYRIFRFITDTLQSKPYQYSTTFYAVMDSNKIEFVDNNLRFITLTNPVSETSTWKGNSYINRTPITANTAYANWDYEYTNFNTAFTTRKGIIKNTYTVLQIADSSATTFNPNNLYSKTYSVEVYGKGIGLIYKEFINYFYQTTPSKYYEDGSFGVRLNLIDYK